MNRHLNPSANSPVTALAARLCDRLARFICCRQTNRPASWTRGPRPLRIDWAADLAFPIPVTNRIETLHVEAAAGTPQT